jgi:hypothetical protein
MDRLEMHEKARGAIEQNLDTSIVKGGDAVYDAAYQYAYKALVDAGVPESDAREVARYVATGFAAP